MLAGIRSRLTVGLVAPVAALAFAPSCLADQFAVDTTKDGVDANIADDACATANGKCTLRAAVLEANDTDGVDTIQLPARTFKLTRPPSLTAGGALFLSEAVILEGEGARKSVVEQTVNDRVVLSDAAPDGLLPGAILSNLTITGGRMRKTSDPSGGGIRALDHMLLLEDVIVRDNSVRPRGTTNAFGGGVSQQAGRLIVRNSTIRGNLVAVKSEIASAFGGGLNVQTGELEVEGSTISRNVARQTGSPGRSNGGGILTRVPTTITGSTIAGNTADDGGGIRVADPEGTLELTASTLSGNRAMKGGGLLVANNTADSLVNSTFSGNRITSNAFDAGGAGLYVSLGQVGLAHVTLARNRPRPEQATLEATGTVGFTDLHIRGSVSTTGAGGVSSRRGSSLRTTSTSTRTTAACPRVRAPTWSPIPGWGRSRSIRAPPPVP